MLVKHYVHSVDVVLEIQPARSSIRSLDVVLSVKIVDSRIIIWFAIREVFFALITRFVVRMEVPVSRIRDQLDVAQRDSNVLEQR
jgi:hypothetical protein